MTARSFCRTPMGFLVLGVFVLPAVLVAGWMLVYSLAVWSTSW
ncbi:MAG: hypothetical protein QOE51_2063 [Actinoplanes sp.]|jgi:hypothetical protein|nr:hypothetical protein [Actinoplanes sp.]